MLVGNTLWETAMQQEVRPDRLARVASIDALLSICLMPLGNILAGPISSALGVRPTLLLAAALMCPPEFAVVAFVPRDTRGASAGTNPPRHCQRPVELRPPAPAAPAE